jgi:hypothetical protein
MNPTNLHGDKGKMNEKKTKKKKQKNKKWMINLLEDLLKEIIWGDSC